MKKMIGQASEDDMSVADFWKYYEALFSRCEKGYVGNLMAKHAIANEFCSVHYSIGRNKQLFLY